MELTFMMFFNENKARNRRLYIKECEPKKRTQKEEDLSLQLPSSVNGGKGKRAKRGNKGEVAIGV